MFDMTICSF